MVEKEGHKRHMQTVRQGWIDEGKPRSSVHEDSIFDEPALPRNDAGREQMATRNAPVFDIAARPVSDVSQRERLRTPAHGDRVDDDNIYDATPRAPRVAPAVPESAAVSGGSIFGPRKDAEEPDDLDALFADEEMEENGAFSTPRPAIAATDEQDDLDALLAEAENENISLAATRTVAAEPDFDDEMEAMAGMDW
jgi:replication fork protection complex subunit Csm3/Swi3